MKITFLGHSGFLVDIGEKVLVFDYEKGDFALPTITGRDTIVFVSHRHRDHFSNSIFTWGSMARSIRYVLSSDIRSNTIPLLEDSLFQEEKQIVQIHPDESVQCGSLQIRTLHSTDEGVAFLVECGGLCIYHAGDLNWWHWQGEPEAANAEMGRRYRAEIDKLRGERIDVAFLPVDPRQGPDCVLGLDYFMRTADVKMAFPMHFWGDRSIFSILSHDSCTKDYCEKIFRLASPGQSVETLLLPQA